MEQEAEQVLSDSFGIDPDLQKLWQTIAKLPQFAVEATKRVLNMHMERSVLATIDFALACEYESFTTDELRANLDAALTP